MPDNPKKEFPASGLPFSSDKLISSKRKLLNVTTMEILPMLY